MPRLTLASTSRYRKELLSRLRLPFEVRAPDVDETSGVFFGLLLAVYVPYRTERV